MDDAEIIIQRIVEPRTTIGGISVEDSAVINNRLTAIEAVSVPDNLDDLVPGAAANQVPVRQADGTWQPRPHVTGISTLTDGTDTRSNVTKLIGGDGIDVAAAGAAGEGTIQAKFGGTGASTAVARSDHTHNKVVFLLFPFGSSGNLSSGGRTLVSQNAAGFDPLTEYILQAEVKVDLKNSVNAGRVRLYVNITTTARERQKPITTVGGVSTEWSADNAVFVGGAGSYGVSAEIAYLDGDATNVEGGVLVVTGYPRR